MGAYFSKPTPPLSLPDDIVFVSLGMVVLDELRFPDGKVLHNIAGGSALYSTLGARVTTTGSSRPERLGCLVLAGRDFPKSVTESLKTWDVSLVIARDATRLSTRGLLQYQGNGFSNKTFAYTTPPLQPAPADLEGSPLLRSTALHFLASPEKLSTFVAQLMELRAASRIFQKPLLVWEPAPLSCTATSQDAHLSAAKLVDVYSPNHNELLSTFRPGEDTLSPNLDRATIEQQAVQVLQSGVGANGKGIVVIRCGEHGSLIVSRSYPCRWFPAFHDSTKDRVVDATGAGNAFLGGFTVTFGETGNLAAAAIAGTVAASYTIEQVGLPERGCIDGREVWNGEEFSSRVQHYHTMLA